MQVLKLGHEPKLSMPAMRKRTETMISRTRGLRLSKYIQNLFRNKTSGGGSSVCSNRVKTSEAGSLNSQESEQAVRDFQKRVQNLPQRRAVSIQDQVKELHRSHTLEESPRCVRRSIDSERSSNRSNSKDKGESCKCTMLRLDFSPLRSRQCRGRTPSAPVARPLGQRRDDAEQGEALPAHPDRDPARQRGAPRQPVLAVQLRLQPGQPRIGLHAAAHTARLRLPQVLRLLRHQCTLVLWCAVFPTTWPSN